MATELGRMITYLVGLLPIMSHDPPNLAGCWLTLRGSYLSYSTLWSRGLARLREKLKPLYFYYHCAYCHQTCRMVTNIQGFLAILLYPLVTWTWEFAWETKNIYSPRQCQWPPNLAGWGYIMRSFLPYTQTTILSRDIVRSRKVLDQLYLYYFKD